MYLTSMQQPATFSLPHTHKTGDLSWDRLHARAGVSPSTTYSTGEFFRLWEAADEEFADPAAGLRLGHDGISQGYGVAALVALHAPDFRTALTALARYKRLTCPELIEDDESGDHVTVRYRWLLATTTVPRLLVDMVLASLAELVREGTAGRVSPVRIELARRLGYADALRQHIACPIVFNAAQDAMLFDRGARDVPFVTADGGAFARVIGGLEQRLRDSDGPDTFIADVRVAIAGQLSAETRADVAAVAARLALSSRTLQRRLDENRTSFGEQLAAVRRLTARRLLTATNFDAVAIALLLGFAEPNSFARAFRRWENTTPARWRERQAALA
jgi:AraC-like DNA-binding protein